MPRRHSISAEERWGGGRVRIRERASWMKVWRGASRLGCGVVAYWRLAPFSALLVEGAGAWDFDLERRAERDMRDWGKGLEGGSGVAVKGVD